MQIFAPLFSAARSVAGALVAIAAPRQCLMCGSVLEDRTHRIATVCNVCMAALPAAPTPDELLNRLIRHFRPDELSVSSAFAFTLYDEAGQFSRVIRALKYAQTPSVGIEFGQETGETMHHLGILRADVVVPVPIHHARRRERTYNQAELIAEGIARATGIRLLRRAILRKRYTTTQTRLNAEERHSNLTGAFVAGRDAPLVQDKTVLLTDDVLTTGSTINACATALLEVGARRVDVAVIAAAI